MTSDYGARAAAALNELLPGQHRDKTLARMFGCSVRMAKYLRAGQCWTVDRLNQASAMLGVAFDAALASDEQHYTELADITERLARLEARIAEVDRGSNAGLAPPARTETRPVGREVAEPARTVGREIA